MNNLVSNITCLFENANMVPHKCLEVQMEHFGTFIHPWDFLDKLVEKIKRDLDAVDDCSDSESMTISTCKQSSKSKSNKNSCKISKSGCSSSSKFSFKNASHCKNSNNSSKSCSHNSSGSNFSFSRISSCT